MLGNLLLSDKQPIKSGSLPPHLHTTLPLWMIPPAGAMFSTSPYQPQSTSSPSSTKANAISVGQELGKKPKKVNSEVRKQQNRIASRNYREKRKRKLQYLQRLLKDGESPEQDAQAVEGAYGERMVTPEYHANRLPAPAFTLPSNTCFTPLASTSGNAIDPIFSTSTTPYDRQPSRTPQNYSTYGNSCHPSMYSTCPNVNMPAWTVPAWMPNVEYSPSVSSRPEEFQYNPPVHTHHTFESFPTAPQQPRTPEPDSYVIESYSQCMRPGDQQTMGTSHVSLPSSASPSPLHYARYVGP